MSQTVTAADELTHRLEGCEARAWSDLYRRVSPGVRKTCGVRLHQVGGAQVMVAAGVNVLGFNRVVSLGLAEPPRDDILDDIVGLYRRSGARRFFVQASPVAGPALRARLRERGFRHYNNWVKLYRGVEPAPAVETDLRIEVIGSDHKDSFGAIVSDSLGWPAAVRPWVAALIGRPGWTHYLAFDGQRPVATAALFVEAGCGWLDFAATRPDCRGRGAQSALLARRIEDAATLGCELLVVETAQESPGKPARSLRNILRFGFEAAYLRPNFIFGLSGELL